MNRQRSQSINARSTLTIACAIAALLSLLPSSLTTWTQAPANLVSLFVAPVQFGLTKVLAPIAIRRRPDPAATAAEVEHLRTRYLQLDAENRQLKAQIESLQKGIPLAQELGTPRIVARSLGLRGSLLQLRTDQVQPLPDGRSPIGRGSVVVIDGINLVGRVVEPGKVATLAELVTDIRDLRAIIRPVDGGVESADPAGPVQQRVLLSPTPGGRLTGSVFSFVRAAPASSGSPAPPARPVKVGDRLRLDDPNWPRFAQMLVLGEVESVSTAQNDRQIVTVRPVYEVRELAGADFTILIQPPLDAPGQSDPARSAGRGGNP